MMLIGNSKLPDYIKKNLKQDKNYYSLKNIENIKRCKTDPDYLGDVILANENLIWYSVHKYIGKPEKIVDSYCIEKDDILQLGRLGFIKAIKSFDTSRGIKFSSFAVIAIVREIRCYLRDSANIIRPTRTANELIRKIKNIENELGYLPPIKDLVALLGEKESKIVKAIQVGKPIKYLNETVNLKRLNTVSYLDLISNNLLVDENITDKIYVDSILESLKDKISDLELNVFKMRINGYSQTQTARQQKISPMRVNRIMKKITNLIKDYPDLMSSA